MHEITHLYILVSATHKGSSIVSVYYYSQWQGNCRTWYYTVVIDREVKQTQVTTIALVYIILLVRYFKNKRNNFVPTVKKTYTVFMLLKKKI